MTLQVPTVGNSITERLHRARDGADVVSGAQAAYAIVRQGRLMELAYGAYCEATAGAAGVRSSGPPHLLCTLRLLERHLRQSAATLSRRELIDRFQHRYAVADLPHDFHWCRAQGVARVGSRLVLGEYGTDSARLAVVSRDRCDIYHPYGGVRGVRHIHLVCPTGVPGEVFVTTGDATKLCDRLTIAGGTPALVRRHRSRLAGYTAAARAAGECFFGTDFSGRPNYLETLQGDKYFFPADAYRSWVVSLTPLWKRYVVALSVDMLAELRGENGRTVSVFDASDRTFVSCTPWTTLFGR